MRLSHQRHVDVLLHRLQVKLLIKGQRKGSDFFFKPVSSVHLLVLLVSCNRLSHSSQSPFRGLDC